MNDYFAYIRVSTAKQGQTGVSLQEQRDAIERYAERHNIAISEWVEERETAAKRGRTKFTAMLRQLRARKAAGVLMHKIDRSARNLRDWADLGDLMDLGIEVRFVTDNLDLSSRGGRLTADIQAVVAADYIRNLREEARKGFYGRLKQGLYPLPAPLGYLDQGTGKPKAIDPERGPLVAKAFKLYATGDFSLDRLRARLIREGLTNRNGRAISRGALSRLLNNPFYSGVIRVRSTGETFRGCHEPLVSPARFKLVGRILSGKTSVKVRQHAFLYKGLLTCAGCLRTLTGERQKGAVYYRCHNKACRGTSIREDMLNAHVSEVFERVRLNPSEAELLTEELGKAMDPDSDLVVSERRALALREKQLHARLERLTDLLVDETLPAEVYYDRREKVLFELTEIERRQAELDGDERAGERRRTEMFELVKTAQLSLQAANAAEKRELLKETCSNFLVSGKKPSVELLPAYQALANRERVPGCGPYRAVFRKLAWAIARSANDHDWPAPGSSAT